MPILSSPFRRPLTWFVLMAGAACLGCGRSDAPPLGMPQPPAYRPAAPQPAEPAPAAAKTPEPDPEPSSPADAALRKLGIRVQGIEANAMNIQGRVVRLHPRFVTPEGTLPDDVLKPLQEMPHLILGVDGTPLSDAGLEQLASIDELNSLSMISCQNFTDAGLAHLRRLPRLESLFLNNTKITDAGLAHLRDLKTLKLLNLYGTTITDDGLASLEGLDNLSSLSLISCRDITDAGFKHLHALKNLKMLWLINTKIGDAGVLALNPASPLEEVAFNNTKVTSAGADKFRKLFPDCAIVGP